MAALKAVWKHTIRKSFSTDVMDSTTPDEEAHVLPVTEQQTPATSEPAAARKDENEEAWWHIHPFRGMVHDIRRRAPYYLSDWTDAWDYRVVPATVYMYFAK